MPLKLAQAARGDGHPTMLIVISRVLPLAMGQQAEVHGKSGWHAADLDLLRDLPGLWKPGPCGKR